MSNCMKGPVNIGTAINNVDCFIGTFHIWILEKNVLIKIGTQYIHYNVDKKFTEINMLFSIIYYRGIQLWLLKAKLLHMTQLLLTIYP